jgi:hypothetical protein
LRQLPPVTANLGGNGAHTVEAQQPNKTEPNRTAAHDGDRVARTQANLRQRMKGNAQGITPNQHPFVEGHIFRQWHAIDSRGDNVLRVPVEDIALLVTEATISGAAGRALAAASDDIHGDAVTDGRSGIAPALHHLADDLVTGVASQRIRSSVTFHLATADGRRTDLDQNLARLEIGRR